MVGCRLDLDVDKLTELPEAENEDVQEGEDDSRVNIQQQHFKPFQDYSKPNESKTPSSTAKPENIEGQLFQDVARRG